MHRTAYHNAGMIYVTKVVAAMEAVKVSDVVVEKHFVIRANAFVT